MKSRFTAYARGMVGYIIATTDPKGAAWQPDAAAWRRSIEQFSTDFEFAGVDVVDEHVSGDEGTVHFRARLRADDDRDASFSEISEFVRRDGRWLYTDGVVQK
jgi:uncharacterized protein YchJ